MQKLAKDFEKSTASDEAWINIFMADTAYDSDRLRNAVAEKGAVAVIPNNPSLAQKYPWISTSMPNVT
jgi:hypothetical protein